VRFPCATHFPLYRQSLMLEREAGLSISRATMDGWVMRSGDLLIPVAAAIGRELLSGGYIQADETPVPVQMHDGSGKNHQAYLWQYGRPGGSVMFDFRMGRGREGPLKFLSKFEGILQTDGYSAYERVGGPKIVHAACWAHARRKFVDAVKLNPDDRIAAQMIARIDELFAIDAEARNTGMDHAGRHALRQERSRPLLDRLRSEIEAVKSFALPSSALRRRSVTRCRFGANWDGFWNTRKSNFSNNLAENSMRPVVKGSSLCTSFSSI
jgi:transposase